MIALSKVVLPTPLRPSKSTPLEATLISWAYQAFAAPCAASLKIMRIGQDSAQWALTQALSWIPKIVESSLNVERDWAGAFNPFIDIASDRHERAYARLFIS
jgi:urease accessory protein